MTGGLTEVNGSEPAADPKAKGKKVKLALKRDLRSALFILFFFKSGDQL